MVVDINIDNFDKEVLNHKGVVIMDFYGTWCMPCKMLAPVLEKIANEHPSPNPIARKTVV